MAKKTMKMKKTAPKAKPSRVTTELRRHPRMDVDGLRVTETSGDFMYAVEAMDISEGGIFLKKRLMTTDQTSKLRIHFESGAVDVEAQPIRDQLGEEFGAGYCFVYMNKKTEAALVSAIKAL